MGQKHIPQRTCVACRQVKSKREMVRLVRTPTAGVQIDETGKKSGRGAYLCRNACCWETALARQTLEHALKTNLTAEEKAALQAFANRLPRLESSTAVS
jgi:predicted RNA-binding protein YlxR (DUF448 family)